MAANRGSRLTELDRIVKRETGRSRAFVPCEDHCSMRSPGVHAGLAERLVLRCMIRPVSS